MPNLSIKNVPAELVDKLRTRAERNHRSMQGELMVVLQEGLARPDWPARSAGPGQRQGKLSIGEIVERNRRRWGEPTGDPPFAVDIIRADRDERSR
jgi:antitoxin FitA